MTSVPSASAVPFNHDPNYVALSRTLPRLAYLILLTSTGSETIDLQLAHLQKQTQTELYSPLPFHRSRWLRSVESARTLLLKLEHVAKDIKVQRTKRDAIKDLAEKRAVIKKLRTRIEEIEREVETSNNNTAQSEVVFDDDTETMYDVLQQIRRARRKSSSNGVEAGQRVKQPETTSPVMQSESADIELRKREELFSSNSNLRRRPGTNDKPTSTGATTTGFSDPDDTEQTLMGASKEHEDLTVSLVNMAVQLKQQARQFQFALEQDKGILDRAIEGLDQNVSAMSVASKGMKTLQRMSEEQGWLGRLRLYAYIVGLWVVAILLVFAGPKLRF